MSLAGKRVAVLAENHYQVLELWYPVLRMREEGAKVSIIGTGHETYSSKEGYPAPTDGSADQLSASAVDAIVIPGGYAPDYMRRYPALVNLVRDAHFQGKIIAAICHAGWVLASAEILQGRKVTSVRAIKDDLVHAGANWVDEEVVRDGNIITSRGPDDLPAFCRAIITALGGSRVSAEVVASTTAREAFAMAITAEEQSAAFYQAAVRRTADNDAKAMFQELAEEELRHKARLEKEYGYLTGNPEWVRYALWRDVA